MAPTIFMKKHTERLTKELILVESRLPTMAAVNRVPPQWRLKKRQITQCAHKSHPTENRNSVELFKTGCVAEFAGKKG
jgi:hypothetical protein